MEDFNKILVLNSLVHFTATMEGANKAHHKFKVMKCFSELGGGCVAPYGRCL